MYDAIEVVVEGQGDTAARSMQSVLRKPSIIIRIQRNCFILATPAPPCSCYSCALILQIMDQLEYRIALVLPSVL